ncbi:DUF1987 domain-containing protein [Sesbania bispinosa]|nr:DUF1987 domain-containing protein [Sesbania bispinosa]
MVIPKESYRHRSIANLHVSNTPFQCPHNGTTSNTRRPSNSSNENNGLWVRDRGREKTGM